MNCTGSIVGAERRLARGARLRRRRHQRAGQCVRGALLFGERVIKGAAVGLAALGAAGATSCWPRPRSSRALRAPSRCPAVGTLCALLVSSARAGLLGRPRSAVAHYAYAATPSGHSTRPSPSPACRASTSRACWAGRPRRHRRAPPARADDACLQRHARAGGVARRRPHGAPLWRPVPRGGGSSSRPARSRRRRRRGSRPVRRRDGAAARARRRPGGGRGLISTQARAPCARHREPVVVAGVERGAHVRRRRAAAARG